eukprot:846048-Ditylum_brightwellii.AAC.1
MAAHYEFIYKKLEDFFKKYGNKCVVDSTFSLMEIPYLLKSSRTDTISEDAYRMMLNVEATSMRQMDLIRACVDFKDHFQYEGPSCLQGRW